MGFESVGIMKLHHLKESTDITLFETERQFESHDLLIQWEEVPDMFLADSGSASLTARIRDGDNREHTSTHKVTQILGFLRGGLLKFTCNKHIDSRLLNIIFNYLI